MFATSIAVAALSCQVQPETAPQAGSDVPSAISASLVSVGSGDGRVEVRLPGIGPVTLALRPMRAVTPDAVVETGSEKRTVDAGLTKAIHAMRHFEGSVEGLAGSSAYVGVGSTGVASMIDLGDGRGLYALRRIDSEAKGLCAGPSAFVRIGGLAEPEVERCRCLHASPPPEGGVAGAAGGIAPGVRKVIELAVDSDNEFYEIFPSETALAEYAAALVGEVSSIYRRDCDAAVVMSYLRVQPSADDLFNQNDPLNAFRQYWFEQGAEIDRDLFTLLTGRRNLPYGGVAYLSTACNPEYGYSVNGYLIGAFVAGSPTNPANWDVNVVSHELGHNVGTLHTHDYGIDACADGFVQRGTIMSYCHVLQGGGANVDLYFHSGTVSRMEAFMSTAPCLSSDCDDDGVADAEEIAADASLDANADGIIDACQDCDADGTPDPVQIAAGSLADADGDGRPDSCEDDCDSNGVTDSADAAANPELDRNGNTVLAACEADCDGDGVADSDQINADMTLDRNRDARLDSCEDCDGDGTLDFAALRGSRSRWVASAGDALLRELDPRSGVVRREVAAGEVPASDLTIGGDGRLYAAAGNRVWALDRAADAAASPWGPVLDGEVRSVAAAPDGRIAAMLSTGRIMLISASGETAVQYAEAFSADDARDLVFRRLTNGTNEAFATTGAGLIVKFTWPAGVRTQFADLTAEAPGLRGIHPYRNNTFLVAASGLRGVYRVSNAGALQGRWDIQSSGLTDQAYAIADARDNRSLVVTSPTGSSTVNGYEFVSGRLERTLRSYGADAPGATAIAIAPASDTDRNGNLVPDACEPSIADLSGDGIVDGADLGLLLGAWGECPGCAADFDGSDSVNGLDLGFLLGVWGR
jgi:hypothetical protein